jgi:hypothetical protein
MVWIIVAAAGESSPVAAAGPPSTATTEYVALRTNGSSATFRGMNGSDEPSKKSEDRAKSEELEVLSFMMTADEDTELEVKSNTCWYTN